LGLLYAREKIMKKYLKDPIDFIFSLFFLILFIHLTRENLQYSESFSLIPMREIDDYSFLKIINEFIHDIKNLNFGYLFNHYYFGYGNIWWTLNAIILFPIHKFHSLHIFLPRFLSELFAMLSLILLYIPLRKVSKMAALLVVVITGFSLTFIQFATFFHNHSVLFFLSSLLFYLFIQKKMDFKNLLILNSLAMLGIAIKITFFPVGLFFIVMAWLKYQKHHQIDLKTVLKGVGVILVSYTLSISPLNLFIYNIPESFRSYFDAIFHGSAIDNYTPRAIEYYKVKWDINQVTMHFYNTHYEYFIGFFIFLLILSLFFLSKRPFRLLPVLALYVYTIVLYFFYIKGFQNWDLAMYSSNLVGIFYLSLYYLFKYQKKVIHHIFVFVFTLLLVDNVYCVYKFNQHVLFKYSNDRRVQRDNRYLELVGKGADFLEKYPAKTFARIYYSFDLPHIFGMYHPFGNKEDILFDYNQIRKEYLCTFFIFTHVQTPPEEYTVVFTDDIGGFGYNKKCKLSHP
jgi:hypothetical protein